MMSSPSVMRRLASISLIISASGIAFAQEPVPKVSDDYADAIAEAQADLDAGRIVDGLRKLEATGKCRRGFEYDYLAARAKAAPDSVAEGESTLELWSLADIERKFVANVGERYNFGEGLTFSPHGDLVATGGMFDICLYDARTGKQTHSMKHASYTMGLEFSPDGA
jgi:hypothetical protein